MLLKAATRSLICFTAVASALPQRSSSSHASPKSDHGCVDEEDKQPSWYQRNLNTIQTVYDFTVYPANAAIISQGGKAVPPGLFAPDATGRVSPIGNFTGYEDSIEYFFALAPTPQGNPASTAFYKAEIVDFVSACPDVAASLVYFRTAKMDEAGNVLDGRKTTLSQVDEHHRSLRRRQHHADEGTTLSQIAFFHFNEKGEIDKYQAFINNLQAWTKAATGIDYNSMQVQEATAQQLCPQIQKTCTGKNQQFTSVDDCSKQLSAKPFGNFNEAWGDNLACRTTHALLTIARPDVYCEHVGPTGGNKCVDIDYSEDYFDDADLFGEPLGSTFTCSGQLYASDNGPARTAQQALAQMVANGGSSKKHTKRGDDPKPETPTEPEKKSEEKSSEELKGDSPPMAPASYAEKSSKEFSGKSAGSGGYGETKMTESPEKPSTETPSTDKPSTETPSTDKPSTEKPSTETPSTDKPSTEKPSTEKPSTEKPSTDKPSTEKPSTEKPSTDKPSTEKPSTEKPSTETPSTDKPSTEKPSTETPSTDKPSTEKPSTDKPSTEKPSTEKPSTDKPSTEKPSTETPSTDKPSTEKPSTETPSTDKPSTEKPSTDKPSTEKPSTETPSTDKPSTEKPSTEKPSTDKPSTEKPSTETPSTDKPSTEKPSTEKPSTEKPSTEKPSTETPSTDKPSTEKPSTEKPSTETPSTDKPSTDKPSTEKPSTEKPERKYAGYGGGSTLSGSTKADTETYGSGASSSWNGGAGGYGQIPPAHPAKQQGYGGNGGIWHEDPENKKPSPSKSSGYGGNPQPPYVPPQPVKPQGYGEGPKPLPSPVPPKPVKPASYGENPIPIPPKPVKPAHYGEDPTPVPPPKPVKPTDCDEDLVPVPPKPVKPAGYGDNLTPIPPPKPVKPASYGEDPKPLPSPVPPKPVKPVSYGEVPVPVPPKPVKPASYGSDTKPDIAGGDAPQSGSQPSYQTLKLPPSGFSRPGYGLESLPVDGSSFVVPSVPGIGQAQSAALSANPAKNPFTSVPVVGSAL